MKMTTISWLLWVLIAGLTVTRGNAQVILLDYTWSCGGYPEDFFTSTICQAAQTVGSGSISAFVYSGGTCSNDTYANGDSEGSATAQSGGWAQGLAYTRTNPAGGTPTGIKSYARGWAWGPGSFDQVSTIESVVTCGGSADGFESEYKSVTSATAFSELVE